MDGNLVQTLDNRFTLEQMAKANVTSELASWYDSIGRHLPRVSESEFAKLMKVRLAVLNATAAAANAQVLRAAA